MSMGMPKCFRNPSTYQMILVNNVNIILKDDGFIDDHSDVGIKWMLSDGDQIILQGIESIILLPTPAMFQKLCPAITRMLTDINIEIYQIS